MKPDVASRLEKGRETSPSSEFRTTAADGLAGLFYVKAKSSGRLLRIISSGPGIGPGDWEHVSVSLVETRFAPVGDVSPSAVPSWEEMCDVRRLFWRADETVVEYHPPAEVYVDLGEVLHLWKPVGIEIPLPPSYLV